MNKTTFSSLMLVCFAALLSISSLVVEAQTNHALTAIATHSGGGSTTYGPDNYNDGVIPAFGNLPWGWVSGNGSIEYTWGSPVQVNSIVFHKDNRPFTSLNVEYWDGTQYVLVMNFSGTAANKDSINFPTVTTTKLRMSSIAGSNPNFREIQAYYLPSAPIDAAVLSVDSPSVFCAGTQAVVATIANRGTSQLNTVTVNWEVNGVVQTPVVYSQLLDTINGVGNNQVQLNLGTVAFNSGVNNVKVYTSAPNNGVDTVNTNDTIYATPTTAAAPTAVNVLSVTLNSATIDAVGGAGTVEYEFGPLGFAQSSGTMGSSPTSLFTINGLTASTTYDVYVRSNCGGTDSSAWVGPITFNTAYGVPYYEDFELFTAGNAVNPWPRGWSSTNNSSAPRWESEDATGANENSLNTGPFYDNTTPSTVGGMYLYLETSGGSLGDSSDMVTICMVLPWET